jgi:exonuclease SbcC
MRGIKNANGRQELTGRDIIIGRNGAGKTTRAQALGIALLGHAPGGGKLPSETIKLANGVGMTVGLETDTFNFTRTFTRDGAKITQTVALNPPNGEKTAAAKEQRIEAELGKFPVMLDFNEFLSLSDMKRREFICEIVGSGTEAWDAERVKVALTDRLRLPDTADPRQMEILEDDIAECAANFHSTDVQAGLQAILEYAKEQTSYWKKERDKAVGAAQKMTEYKNLLAETDRNLDANSKKLDELQRELGGIISERSAADGENARRRASNTKIANLKTEIAAIEASENSDDPEKLRELIAERGTSLCQVNNDTEIAAATESMEAARTQVSALEREVERLRDEFQAVRCKRLSTETLLSKLNEHNGICPIYNRIHCDHKFSNLIHDLTAEMAGYESDLNDVAQRGTAVRTALNTAKLAGQNAQNIIDRLRAEELSALRDNERLRTEIREVEDRLVKAETFYIVKVERLGAKRGELAGLMPENATEWLLIDTTALTERERELTAEIDSLKAKTAEQTKARNTLASLKTSMADGIVAGYHADAWKQIAETVGPKGLRGELVKDALAPLTEDIQAKLRQMNIDRTFYFQTMDGNGKEVFQFGWKQGGERRNFDALSTGEQMLLLIALMTTIIERLNPPLKILAIDNAENLDSGNIRRVLNGLTAAGANLDNIIFSGVMNISPDDVPGWRVWDLSGGDT